MGVIFGDEGGPTISKKRGLGCGPEVFFLWISIFGVLRDGSMGGVFLINSAQQKEPRKRDFIGYSGSGGGPTSMMRRKGGCFCPLATVVGVRDRDGCL